MATQAVRSNSDSNPLGLAGFIISLVGLPTCGILCPVGLVLSIIGLFRTPRGFAIAGTVIGLIGCSGGLVVLLIFGVLAIALVAALAAAGLGGLEMVGDSMNIAKAVEAYQQQHGSLPADLSQVQGIPAEALKDHWGHDYVFTVDPATNTFTISSMGADGVAGNADDMSFSKDSFQMGTGKP